MNGSELANEIKNRIEDGYDPGLAEAIYREQVFIYGADENQTGVTVNGGRYKIFPDVSSDYQKIGKVRKTLKGASVELSRFMSAEPVPEIVGADEIYAQIYQDYWFARWIGDGDEFGGFRTQYRDAWLEGRMHGFGAVVHGLARDRESGQQKVVATHIPATQITYDPEARDPRDADWVYFTTTMPLYQAEQIFDPAMVKARSCSVMTSNGRRREFALVGTYYDVGLGGEKPKMARFLGDLGEKPVHVRNNVHGCIPASWMTNVLLPGMRRHIGQVAMQRASEEMLSFVFDLLSNKAKGAKNFMYMNPELLTPTSQAAFRNKQYDKVLEIEATAWARMDKSNPPIGVIAQPPTDPVLFQVLTYMLQEFNEQQGLSERGRGSANPKEQTKYEIAVSEANVNQNAAGPMLATRMFLRDGMKLAFDMARDYDRHPFDTNLFGQVVGFNDPDEPSSSLGLAFKKPVTIKVGEDSIAMTDNKNQQYQRIQALKAAIGEYVGKGVSTNKFLRRVLEIQKETDIDGWLEADQEMQQGAPGGVPPEMAQALAQG